MDWISDTYVNNYFFLVAKADTITVLVARSLDMVLIVFSPSKAGGS